MEKLPKIALPVIFAVVVLLILLLAKSAVTIDSGEAGVLFTKPLEKALSLMNHQ